ncbi:hypothetical protein POM88_052453 [Heracleum sosnowskyi]|uniref:Retrotransposon gag domain-containing protein n=1 Tax=Heracleum sosnowskyi TaxID=360622 RepID=A0AAD8GRN0_9APIA|nr:hypothetical protein POM88_052453 [Heracleum sosnowskyi]
MANTRSTTNNRNTVTRENLTPSGNVRQEIPNTVGGVNNPRNPQQAPPTTQPPLQDQESPPNAERNLDLTGYTQAQIDALIRVASAFPQPQQQQPQASQLNQHDENLQSEAQSHPRPANSVFSRLGSSQNTRHKEHGGPQHKPETWKENRKKRDLRKDIEKKKAEYERAERRLERDRSPEPRVETGSVQPTNADMLNTILELKRKLEGGSYAEASESPFTKRLENESKQRHIKHINLNSFDGLGDPEEHLSYFDQLALHYEYRDLTRCRFFAATLRGGAQRWFCRLPARSLDSWAEFKRAFLNKFKANQPHEVHTVFLETVAQRNGESLQVYIDRFKEAVNKVVCVNETEALVHLRRGLNPYECEKYVCKLMEVQPTTLARAYDLASQAINEMESLSVLKQSRAPPPPPPRQPYFQREQYTFSHTQKPVPIQHQVQTTHGPGPVREAPATVRDRLGPPVPPRPEKRPEPNWTILSMPRSAILREIKGKPFFQPPQPMWTAPDDRNKDKHCDYHEAHGHTTESCLSLKHFLERQVKQGNLNQYLPRQLQAAAPNKNVVNTVFGGPISPQGSPNKKCSTSHKAKPTTPYLSQTRITKASTRIIPRPSW